MRLPLDMRGEAAALVIGDAQRLPTGRPRRQGVDNPPTFLAGGNQPAQA